MDGTFYWMEAAITFREGETIAAALRRSGIDDFGAAAGAQHGRYFCGIGACQACLVSVEGCSAVEACLTPARQGMRLSAGLPSVGEHCDE